MNMIEKVARVLANFGNGNYQDYTDQAKAAIQAMREPTTKMIFRSIGEENVYEIWIAMIDEALKED